MEESNRPYGSDSSTLELIGRQSGPGVAVGSTILPIGAIIGIAIAGSATLFGVLAVMIMRYLRSRYKSKTGSRDLDLSDDNEEDILDTLRSIHPSERGLVTKTPRRPSKVGSECLPNRWTDIPLDIYPVDKEKLKPPACALEITGLRDSWPLVGWVESASSVPLSASRHPVINSGNADRRISYSAVPLSMEIEPSWPQPTISRYGSSNRGLDGRPIQRAGHSAKSSITSLKRLSSTRKSASDNQLTSILRSTSQRLREQRRPLYRSLSVMSQVSGAPPTIQPPSPPSGDQRGESREALIDTDDMSLVNSVRSSVLNSISQTPSPQKMALRQADFVGDEKTTSPATSEKSEPDSLCPSKTPDLFIPAALTSPSKPGAQADQRYEVMISSRDGRPNTIQLQHKPSLLAGGGNNTTHGDHLLNQIDSASDPFISADSSTEPASKSKSVKGPRPLLKRQAVLDQNSNHKDHKTVTSPLQMISGNQRLPNKSGLPILDTSKVTRENPFQWSPLCSPSLMLSSGQKPTGIKPKGHRRRRTVRISHGARPASVTVVLEEPENESTPPRVHDSIGSRQLRLLSPTNPENASMDLSQNKIPSSRPPSIPVFEPFLPRPPDSQISSDGSYSATMSFYDYYSSDGAFPSDKLLMPEPGQSLTPSTKKSRRRGRNFSVDITRARDFAPLEATTSSIQEGRPVLPPKSAPAQFLNFENPKVATNVPTLASRLYTPVSAQHPAFRDSVTSSVSLLRRMNSEVSTHSTGSFLSDHSNGSPTIPELRGGGLSPTKRGSEGTMNYLNIGLKTPSPTGKRGRVRALGIAGKRRDYHESLAFQDGLEHYDALGLVMPMLEDSPSKQPSLDSPMNILGQGDWSPTPLDRSSTSPKWPPPPRRTKPPAAQLRPVSSASLLQENCHSCNKPLSPLRLNPRDSRLASRYHDHCFKCGTCNEPLGTAFAIDKKPYCKQHYYEKVNKICNVIENRSKRLEQGRSNDRWSDVMITPLKTSVRHQSQLEMPSPHRSSPKSLTEWRESLGLYDDVGFLKSSPSRGHDEGSFSLESTHDLMMAGD